ncbi:hypothetical protein [Saccharolobus islandicus]|uniref:hypothetical protein n=1 Tax=Saccharolobus islandicus TaxID=43080 RepID=UPI00036EDF55|nr:hypothetical protein [Sulfolobus islandicus]
MSSEPSVYTNILQYIISAIISGTISLITALYVRRYVANINRARVLRAIFRHIEIPLSNDKKTNLLTLYEMMHFAREIELFLYFIIYFVIYFANVSFNLFKSIVLYALPPLYFPSYFLFDFVLKTVIDILSCNITIRKIVDNSWSHFDPFHIQVIIYTIVFTVIEVIGSMRYLNEMTPIYLLGLESTIILGIELYYIFQLSNLHIKEDFQSAFFLASGIRPRIKIHLNNSVVDGKLIDVRDELTI